MCGIAGLITHPLPEAELIALGTRMAQTLRHRGPDSSGVWCSPDDGLVLAHRRLAIQDLSEHGHQPMLSASGRYCVSYNGEIYNFQELAAELRVRGCQFRGHSDTEIMLAAVEEYGLTAAVQKFSGMFAFALWDRQDHTLHLCRDRIGEKPLYYGWVGNKFLFASELKAIEAVVERAHLNIDLQALGQFFKYGYINAPHAIYQGIYKLVPGTLYTVRGHVRPPDFSPSPGETRNTPQAYWSLLEIAERGLASRITDEQEAIAGLEEVLSQSVRRQLVADVPVGTFLSGGIDSTTVTALAQRESSKKIKTFTVAFGDAEYDESKYAERIAQHLGTDHLTVRLDARDALDLIPALPTIYDEPFADSSQLPAYLVSKVAREHVTVCLSGDGGDELFAGYNRYGSLDRIWKRVGHIPPTLRRVAGHALGLPSPAIWDRAYKAVAGWRGTNRERLVGLKLHKLAGVLQQPDQMAAYDHLCAYWHHPEDLIAGSGGTTFAHQPTRWPRGAGFLDKAMFWDQSAYLPGDNLAKVDRASMAVSLETRLPLLSAEALEFAWRVPPGAKLKQHATKWILRQILYKHVPSELVDRPKMGFSVPVGSWLRGALKEWAADHMGQLTPLTEAAGPTAQEAIVAVWHQHLTAVADHSNRLWTILAYLTWAASRQRT